jgi:hypothetical protein
MYDITTTPLKFDAAKNASATTMGYHNKKLIWGIMLI